MAMNFLTVGTRRTVVATVALGALACCILPADAAAQTPAPRSAPAPDGRQLYTRCATCHQPTGLGLANTFPPLAGSEYALAGDGGMAARIVLHGLQGPITVAGKRFQGVMPPYGTGQPMTDAEIAAVLTYVRTSFGNRGTPVTAATVARERAATRTRTTPWTAQDLGTPR
jgi:mono/diheme cytochrome c family protein